MSSLLSSNEVIDAIGPYLSSSSQAAMRTACRSVCLSLSYLPKHLTLTESCDHWPLSAVYKYKPYYWHQVAKRWPNVQSVTLVAQTFKFIDAVMPAFEERGVEVEVVM